MSKMGRALAGAGFHTVSIRYPSRKYRIETLAEQFITPEIIQTLSKTEGNIHFVTHSLGGILLRISLPRLPQERIGRTVMLAPPNHGSEIVDRMWRYGWFRSFFGPAAQELGTNAELLHGKLPPLPPRCGILAGDRSAFHIFDSILPAPHDGTVSVASTKEKGAKSHLILNTSHPFIMCSKNAIAETLCFLQNGIFSNAKPHIPKGS